MTVEEILKASGLSDEQIKALDAKVMTGFTTVISTASQERDAAELAKRAQAEMYDRDIAPALVNWANDKAAMDTKIAAYEAALKAAKEGGFAVPEILLNPNPNPNPNPAPVRDPGGRFVPNANPVPGSPQYMSKTEGFQIIGSSQWALAEYMRLNNGAVPPDDFEKLAQEAVEAHMPFRSYIEKKYDFSGKRQAMKDAEQKKHDDAIIAATTEKITKEITERMGSNPMVRMAETSKFSELDKAVKDGARPNPLKQTREQRHASTRQAILKDLSENATVQ